MTKKEWERRFWLQQTLEGMGFNSVEIDTLRRISSTLTRWAEAECGNSNDYVSWSIERDDKGKPWGVVHYHQASIGNHTRRFPVADRESGALRRLAAIMASHTDLWSYHQGDPRGCALYVGSKTKLGALDVNSYYSSHGVAVY